MYIHLFIGTDGSVCFMVQSSSKDKQKAFKVLLENYKRNNSPWETDLEFGSPPSWENHKAIKIGKRTKRIKF